MLPGSLALYRAAERVLRPLAGPWLKSRAAKGKEDPARLGERLGRASKPRPAGPLVWLHGASVGESLMLLAVLEAIRRERPDIGFLVTTGTVTSAELMGRRLPSYVTHQYAPLDVLPAVRRFLGHWRPGLAVVAESELWPNLLLETKASGSRLALVNARFTARSLDRWRRSPAAARRLLSLFDWIGAADPSTAEGLSALSGRPIPHYGNLKRAGDPLPVDEPALAALKALVGGRPAWLAASTHVGEDELVIEAHRLLLADRPDALLLLAPRHPERGAAVAELARQGNFSVRRRAAGEDPGRDTTIYVADTLGEMGLWFRLADVALVCGSLVDRIGGHNPLEAALLGAPILVGPHTDNFRAEYDELVAAGGAVRVRSPAEIAHEIRVIEGPLRDGRIQAAHAVAAGGAGVLEAVMGGLRPLLPDRGHGG